MQKNIFAGAGKHQICLEQLLPIEGFTQIHTRIYARTVIIDCNFKIAIVSLEMTSIQADKVRKLKKIVSEEISVPEEQIWITATHTFSVPHIRSQEQLANEEEVRKNELLQDAVMEAVRESAKEAVKSLCEATISCGWQICSINRNRDIETADGWWIGANPDRGVDHKVRVISIRNPEGKVMAVLYNYAIQPSVLDGSEMTDGGHAVSSDITGLAACKIEKKFPECICISLIGAAGDQVPRAKARNWKEIDGRLTETDVGEAIFPELESEAEELKAAVTAAIKMEKEEILISECMIHHKTFSVEIPAKKMNKNRKSLHPDRNHIFIPDGTAETEAEIFMLGDCALIGVKPELNYATAEMIRRDSPFQHTWVITMVNGAEKYMADRWSYENCTYEAMNSPFGKGAAELLAQAAVKELKELYSNIKYNKL